MSQNWNELYEKGDTPWDKGTHTPVLDVLWKKHPQLFRGRVLVPGCGIGHDARWLAEHGCQVVGIDIAPLAIERAKLLEPELRVDFRLANLFELPEDLRGTFDLVWEHTCLCALDPSLREKYIAAVRSALKPGGKVAGVFFMNPDMDPGETGPPFGITVDELIALWEKGDFEIDEHWVPEVAYEGRVGRERFVCLKKIAIRKPKRKFTKWHIFRFFLVSAAIFWGLHQIFSLREVIGLLSPVFALIFLVLILVPTEFVLRIINSDRSNK